MKSHIQQSLCSKRSRLFPRVRENFAGSWLTGSASSQGLPASIARRLLVFRRASLFCLLLTALSAHLSSALEGPVILRPADQSILAPGPVWVIVRSCEPAELRLGTNSVPLETLAPGVLAAVLSPSAGLHELQLKGGSASQRVSFYVLSVKDDPKAPAGWKEFKPHPPSANCQTCHTVKGNQWSFNTLSFAETCMTCHDTKTFLLGHAHNTEVLSDCVLCHYPHGSTEKFHLKMPRETACKQCHG